MITTKLKAVIKAKTIFLFLITLTLICVQACKKNEVVAIPPDYNQPNGSCIVTQTSDAAGLGVFGDLNFVYDAKGNPLLLNGFVTYSYDAKGRLIKESSTQYTLTITYNDETFLPSATYRRFTSNNALVQTILYTYDNAGRVIKTNLLYVNAGVPGEIIWKYNYNTGNNIQTIIDPVSGDTIIKVKSYDNKPNFLGGNQWIKYILNDPTSGYFPMNYFLFSANNPVEWSINDNFGGLIIPVVNAYYKYNSKGYAVSDSVVFRNPAGDFSGVQTSVFNCR
ncbi:MAG: hypothetical protein LH615_16370 [Ferruginibacter sp.]|nr:hypothetical protein [Ferruginibacter sp.]